MQHMHVMFSFSSDIDECAMNSTVCDQICVNTFGSYMCSCRSGFRLNNISNQCEGNATQYNLYVVTMILIVSQNIFTLCMLSIVSGLCNNYCTADAAFDCNRRQRYSWISISRCVNCHAHHNAGYTSAIRS